MFGVHVHPGARESRVGGTYDGRLVVRVRARAVDGAANEEVLCTVAAAFGLTRRDVDFVRVGRSRDKLIVVEDTEDVRTRHRALERATPTDRRAGR
ncbi:MAG: DUF167 domain-containing protein [Acidobacteriota bacterium]|nr:DUF167 domain-containing protein [Acidobacteriota bacterium]